MITGTVMTDVIIDATTVGTGAVEGEAACPGWDSNPHCTVFETARSTGWRTGARTHFTGSGWHRDVGCGGYADRARVAKRPAGGA